MAGPAPPPRSRRSPPGLLAVGVLALAGATHRSRLLVHLALLAPVTAAAGLLVRTDPGRTAELLQLPLLLVFVEAAALAGARDLLWREPSDRLAFLAELGALLVLPTALQVAVSPALAEQLPGATAAAAVAPDAAAAAAWLVAALAAGLATVRHTLPARRVWLPGLVAVGLLAGAGVASATDDPVAVSLVLAVTALAAAVSRGGRDTAAAVVAGAVGLVAVVSGVAHPAGVLPAAALVVAAGVLPVARGIADGRSGTRAALVGTLTALAAIALVTLAPAEHLLADPAMAVVAVLAFVALAVGIDRDRVAADAARGAVVLVSLAVLPWTPGDAAVPLVVAAVLLLAETVRLGRPWLAPLAAVPVHHALVVVGVANGASPAVIGLCLVAGAVGWAAVSLAADARWHLPVLAIAASVGPVGWALTLTEQRAAGVATLLVGAAAVVAGVARGRPLVGHVGGGLLTLGTWLLLEDASVGLVEAYAAPVAAHLAGAGHQARRRDQEVSSWVAYAPAILLLAGPALVERLAGGGGGHALVVGTVGVVAVTAGAFRRLAAPLVLGVLLLVGVTLHEAFAVVASVPTWAWLATGGAVLLAAGVALERAGTSPVAAGRRAVAGFTQRFV